MGKQGDADKAKQRKVDSDKATAKKNYYTKQRKTNEEQADEGDTRAQATVAKINKKLGKPDRQYTDSDAINKPIRKFGEAALALDTMRGFGGMMRGAGKASAEKVAGNMLKGSERKALKPGMKTVEEAGKARRTAAKAKASRAANDTSKRSGVGSKGKAISKNPLRAKQTPEGIRHGGSGGQVQKTSPRKKK